jgi:S1-C subfamily serine protease
MPISLAMALTLLAYPQGTASDPPSRGPISPAEIVSALETTLADVISAVEPSVVAIHRDKSENEETTAIRGRLTPPAERRMPMHHNLDPFNSDAISLDYGSGVVVGEKGEILTAFHVVKGASRLVVWALNLPRFEAEIIAADPRSDLAVIVPRGLPETAYSRFKPIKIGDAGKLRKGNFLLALGNPFNAARLDGRASASWGILSNVARRMDLPQEEQAHNESQLRHFPTLLQLDSKLNLGMSGGAVVNLKGELVGLTTAAGNASGFDAMAGYAIPMDQLGRNVVEALKEGKEYEYGFLGINLDIENRTNRVRSAAQGSPAAAGGVQVDDQIVAVGDIPVTDSESLVIAINSIPAGEPVVLKLLRRNVTMERTVELAKRRVMGQVIATNRPEPWRGIRVEYSSTLASTNLNLEEVLARRGVLVTEVETGSEADRAGLKAGQVISRVGDKPVPNPRAFRKAVEGVKGPVQIETEQGPMTIK